MSQSQTGTGGNPGSSQPTHTVEAVTKLLGPLDGISKEIRESILQQLLSKGGNLEIQLPSYQVCFGKLANRHKDSFRDEGFEQLKADIEATNGNQIAIIVRPLCGPDTFDKMNQGFRYEVIAGHRRLRACQALNTPVKAIVVPDMSDREAVVVMYAENEKRQNLSPYEAGAMYDTWLREGIYKNQVELAKERKLAASEVSRALSIARLPAVILEAFSSPLELQSKDGEEIGKLLKLDEHAVMESAAALAAQERKSSRSQVLSRLKAAVAHEEEIGSANSPAKEVISVDGKDVGEVRWDTKGGGKIHIQQELNLAAKAKLKKLLAGFLAKEGGAHAPKSSRAPK